MKIQRISDGRVFDLESLDDRIRLRDEHGCRLVWSEPYDVVQSIEHQDYYLIDACANCEPLDLGQFRLYYGSPNGA